MSFYLSYVMPLFAHHGVVHREAVKNSPTALRRLLRSGFVVKAYKKGKVYYELTDKALPLLELQRRKLVEEVEMRRLLEPKSLLYSSLLGDLRFLDERRPEAKDFLFLGDWQLTRPVVPSQLELSKLRFYHREGLT